MVDCEEMLCLYAIDTSKDLEIAKGEDNKGDRERMAVGRAASPLQLGHVLCSFAHCALQIIYFVFVTLPALFLLGLHLHLPICGLWLICVGG
jgi:hypothetical protein